MQRGWFLLGGTLVQRGWFLRGGGGVLSAKRVVSPGGGASLVQRG